MTDDEFQKVLLETFSTEAAEHVQTMTSGLLELEKAPSPERRVELVESIFRDAHSLKGAARAVNRTDIEAVCQAMESVFAAWKRQPSEIPVEAFDDLNRAVDLVSRLLTLPTNASSAADKDAISAAVRQLATLLTARATKRLPPREVPSTSATAGIPKAQEQPRELPTERFVAADTVRIPTAKLDAVLLEAEQMLGVKLALQQHTGKLRETREMFAAWRSARDKERAHAGSANGASLTDGFPEWSTNFIETLEEQVTALVKSAEQHSRTIGAQVDDLLDHAKELVMLPFSTVLDAFPKLVRDLARDEGKEVELRMHGREVEIDKRILEAMKDPLIHLVRNAVDHGIEAPAARAAAGKPARASLSILVAQREGGKVELHISDDGAGIDVAEVRASAVKSGAITAEEAALLDDERARQLIFQSGVSTSPMITEISGRGLGMAIVREKVENAGGQVSLESTVGIGTTFRIRLPVTLATFKGVLVLAGGETFVIPTLNLERIARVKREEIGSVEGRATIQLKDQVIALVSLAEVLELPAGGAATSGTFTELVVLGAGEKRVAFSVEAVLGEQEVLVKALGKPLVRVRNVAGATVLGSGKLAVILDAADLLKSAATSGQLPASASTAAPTPEPVRARVLVADDSLTSRMLLKNILESAGYLVTTAVDGLDAFTTLHNGEFDLLISDVEMPHLDGFELTAKVRADQRLAELPVVLVTALGSREHQERGVDAGANAYIVKSSFDQASLLEVVKRLV